MILLALAAIAIIPSGQSFACTICWRISAESAIPVRAEAALGHTASTLTTNAKELRYG